MPLEWFVNYWPRTPCFTSSIVSSTFDTTHVPKCFINHWPEPLICCSIDVRPKPLNPFQWFILTLAPTPLTRPRPYTKSIDYWPLTRPSCPSSKGGRVLESVWAARVRLPKDKNPWARSLFCISRWISSIVLPGNSLGFLSVTHDIHTFSHIKSNWLDWEKVTA